MANLNPVVRLQAEEIAKNITEVESLCMNCREQGLTLLLPIRIPYFREVIVSSFTCSNCGYENRELMSAATYEEYGIRFELMVSTKADLNRQVAQAKYATIRIPELDFEAPSSRGNLTTVEGIVEQVIVNLTDLITSSQNDESQRETVTKLTEFVAKMRKLTELDANDRVVPQWTLQLIDPTGTSYIENPNAPHRDDHLRTARFRRTAADNDLIGLGASAEDGYSANGNSNAAVAENSNGVDMEVPDSKKRRIESDEVTLSNAIPVTNTITEEDRAEQLMHTEAVEFRVQCGACKSSECMTRMKTVNVPHFRDVIVMATTCDSCGWRDAEVKSGGAMQPKGVRFLVRIDEREDLNRLVLRSETASVLLPELDFESSSSCSASKLTTVEGTLAEIRDHLLSTTGRSSSQQQNEATANQGENEAAKQRNETMLFGDSLDTQQLERIRAFCARIDDVIQLRMTGVHLVIDDSAGNSFVASVTDQPEEDTRLKRVDYERTDEQNESLGINDMKVDNY